MLWELYINSKNDDFYSHGSPHQKSLNRTQCRPGLRVGAAGFLQCPACPDERPGQSRPMGWQEGPAPPPAPGSLLGSSSLFPRDRPHQGCHVGLGVRTPGTHPRAAESESTDWEIQICDKCRRCHQHGCWEDRDSPPDGLRRWLSKACVWARFLSCGPLTSGAGQLLGEGAGRRSRTLGRVPACRRPEAPPPPAANGPS